MRTPGHAMVNAALLAPWFDGAALAAVVAGAVLPDVPIFVLYLWERSKGTPVEVIWSDRYQRRGWLNLIHGMHSIPLALAGLALGLAIGAPPLIGLCASLILHDLLDIPVHAIDAHRHFFPLSDWRFVSPFSYWDTTRHAAKVTALEIALVAAASLVEWTRTGAPIVLLLGAALVLGYAHVYWKSFVRPSPASP